MSSRIIQTVFGPLEVPTPRSVAEMERQHDLMLHCSHTRKSCFHTRLGSILRPVIIARSLAISTLTPTPEPFPRVVLRQWATILGDCQRWKCNHCGKDIRDENHVDHILPLAKGGSNDMDNLQLLCPPCNLRKGSNYDA